MDRFQHSYEWMIYNHHLKYSHVWPGKRGPKKEKVLHIKMREV